MSLSRVATQYTRELIELVTFRLRTGSGFRPRFMLFRRFRDVKPPLLPAGFVPIADRLRRHLEPRLRPLHWREGARTPHRASGSVVLSEPLLAAIARRTDGGQFEESDPDGLPYLCYASSGRFLDYAMTTVAARSP
jgi:hypothetical protein